MAVVTGAVVAGVALVATIIGGIASAVGGIQDAKKKAQAVRIRSRFTKALQHTQVNALQASFSRKIYASGLKENIALGLTQSSFSKSRIGIAGTANEAIMRIADQASFERQGHLLNLQQQLAKLAIQEQSTNKSVELGQDISGAVIGSVAGLASSISSGLSLYSGLGGEK